MTNRGWRGLRLQTLQHVFSFGLLMGPLALSNALAGHAIGNGGDHIRATFLQMGEQVLAYLKTTQEGAELVRRYEVALPALEASLSTQVVRVETEELRDNTGSIVDAIGEPGRVILSRSAWGDHFQSGRDIYFLVFHEMLRATAIDDDDYRVSRYLSPFSRDYWLESRVTPVIPLIGSDLLTHVVDERNAVIGGSGCPSLGLGHGTFLEFNTEKNELALTLHRAAAASSVEQPVGRTQCGIAIPLRVPEGFRLVLTQVDLAGQVNLASTHLAQIQFQSFIVGSASGGGARAGEENTPIARVIEGPQRGRFLMRRTNALVTPCGRASTLRLSASARVQPKADALVGAEERASSSVSDARLTQLRLSLALESCSEGVTLSKRQAAVTLK